MPIIRSQIACGDALSATQMDCRGPMSVDGSMQIGASSADTLTVVATESAAGPRGVNYHEAERAGDVLPLDALYTQPNSPVYDVYYIGDTSVSTSFKMGTGVNLVGHMFLLVNFSANAVPIKGTGGETLGNLPAHCTAICSNGVVLMIATNQLS